MDATIESEGTPAKEPKPMCKYQDKWDSEFTFLKNAKSATNLYNNSLKE